MIQPKTKISKTITLSLELWELLDELCNETGIPRSNLINISLNNTLKITRKNNRLMSATNLKRVLINNSTAI